MARCPCTNTHRTESGREPRGKDAMVRRVASPSRTGDADPRTPGSRRIQRRPGLVPGPLACSVAILITLIPAGALRAEDMLKTLTGEDPSQLSTPLRLLALLTVLSLVPSIVLMTTCFPRVVIVLSFLRRAIGTQELPPAQIMVGLALFITGAIMAPTWKSVYEDALGPYMNQEISDTEAYSRAVAPLKKFMLDRALNKDLRLFLELSKYREELEAKGISPESQPVESLPLNVVIPSFLLSELKTAFQMGFVLYLPFLIIDLVVATTLISMGMLVLPPFMISLPLKVLVFVLVDGWHLVVEQLVRSVAAV